MAQSAMNQAVNKRVRGTIKIGEPAPTFHSPRRLSGRNISTIIGSPSYLPMTTKLNSIRSLMYRGRKDHAQAGRVFLLIQVAVQLVDHRFEHSGPETTAR